MEKKSVFKNVWDLPYGHSNKYLLFDAAKNSKDFAQKLQLQKKLTGVHRGCVNTICWNSTGQYLLSGSDDKTLAVVNGYNYLVHAHVETAHRANVFCAKFLPNTSDNHVVSCSGEGLIVFSDLQKPDTSKKNSFTCHKGTAYELMTVPNDPNTFLSCGEDRTVRWFDMRTKTSCKKMDCKDDILIHCQSPVTALSGNNSIPYQMAIACADSSVRVYDRRMLSVHSASDLSPGRGLNALMMYFNVSTFSHCRRITSLCYSPDGQEILVSYSSDYIYLFDVRDDYRKRPKVLSKSKEINTEDSDSLKYNSDSDSSQFGHSHKCPDERPLMKRVRIRGDWSDTGPNSRPEAETYENVAEATTRRRRPIARTVTDILSRLFNSDGPMSVSQPLASQNPTTSSAAESGNSNNSSEPRPVERLSPDRSAQAQETGSKRKVGQDSDATPAAKSNRTNINQPSTSRDQPTVSLVESDQSGPSSSTLSESLRLDSSELSRLGPSRSSTSGGSSFRSSSLQTSGGSSFNQTRSSSLEPSGPSSFKQTRSSSLEPSGSSSLDIPGYSRFGTFGISRPDLPRLSSLDMPGSSRFDTPLLSKSDLSGLKYNRSSIVDLSRPSTLDTSGSLRSLNLEAAGSSRSAFNRYTEPEANCPNILRPTAVRPVSDAAVGESNLNPETQNLTSVEGPKPSGSRIENVDTRSIGTQFNGDREPPVSQSESTDSPTQSVGRRILINFLRRRNQANDQSSSSQETAGPSNVVPSSSTDDQSTSRRDTEDFAGIGNPVNESDTSSNSSELRVPNEVHETIANRLLVQHSLMSAGRMPTVTIIPNIPPPDENAAARGDNAQVDSDDDDEPPARRRRSCTFFESGPSKSYEEFNDDELDPVTQPRIKRKYIGHRNARTMIKEATFWGDNFVMSGSDCGHIFIWDRDTAELVMFMEADHHVVNCLQPHPFDPILASSGIDYDIKLWAPLREEPYFDQDRANEIMERNEVMLQETKDTITVPASFMFRMFSTLSNFRSNDVGS